MIEKTYRCKHCSKEIYTAEGAFFHLLAKHKIKPTKNDCIFTLKYSFIGRLFYGLVWLIKLILKLICYPFWWLYETLYF